jgi:hypothetical protein
MFFLLVTLLTGYKITVQGPRACYVFRCNCYNIRGNACRGITQQEWQNQVYE